MSDNEVKLGYIGLGKMGAPMATRMVDWPGGLVVFDVRVEAMTPLAEKGAILADSVADVAAADVISVTVLNDEQSPGRLSRFIPRSAPLPRSSSLNSWSPKAFTSSMRRSAVADGQPRKVSWRRWSVLPTRRSSW